MGNSPNRAAHHLRCTLYWDIKSLEQNETATRSCHGELGAAIGRNQKRETTKSTKDKKK
jgi:hypothetical protein